MGQTNKQILRFCVYKLDFLLRRNNVLKCNVLKIFFLGGVSVMLWWFKIFCNFNYLMFSNENKPFLKYKYFLEDKRKHFLYNFVKYNMYIANKS